MRYPRASSKPATSWLALLQGALLVIISGVTCAQQARAADASAADLQAYRQNLALSLQESSSPRDWALASQLLETRPASGAA
jgi:hypothetical protein